MMYSLERDVLVFVTKGLPDFGCLRPCGPVVLHQMGKAVWVRGIALFMIKIIDEEFR